MSRQKAFLSVLKFFFQHGLVTGSEDRRTAWLHARNDAAVYCFLAPSENLKVWVPTE